MRSRYLLAVVLPFIVSCNPSKRFALPAKPGVAGDVVATWREHAGNPLLRPEASEPSDVLNPSVLHWRDKYWNLYSGFDGKTWHTGAAVSANGLDWTSRKSRILSPDPSTWEGPYIAANGSALAVDSMLFYWFQAGKTKPSIGLARSSDGHQWTKHPTPVLDPGPRGSWDELGVADPYVIRASDGTLYLYYTGMDRAKRQRLGVARSGDGVRWEKSLDNPILDIGGHEAWDEGGLGEPAVWASQESYWLLYTGRAWDEKRRMGLASSADGIHWEKVEKAVFAGAAPWDSAVICDATVITEDGLNVRVWFGGGDKPKPDEGLNGAIGYAGLTLSLPRGRTR